MAEKPRGVSTFNACEAAHPSQALATGTGRYCRSLDGRRVVAVCHRVTVELYCTVLSTFVYTRGCADDYPTLHVYLHDEGGQTDTEAVVLLQVIASYSVRLRQYGLGEPESAPLPPEPFVGGRSGPSWLEG